MKKIFVLLCLVPQLCLALQHGGFIPKHSPLTEEIRVPLTVQDHSNYMLVHVSVNNEEGLFLLDTGANICALSQEFAKKLELKSEDLSSPKIQTNVTTGMQAGKVDVLKIEGAIFNDFNAVIVSLAHLNRSKDKPVDGIIGMNLLTLIPTITIDYKKQILTLNPQESHGKMVPVELAENLIYTNMVVDGQSIKMMIDSGASMTIVDPQTSDTLKERGKIQERQTVIAKIANINKAEKKEIQVLSINQLALGDLVVKNHSAYCLDAPNLFGMNFFKHYVVTFDFREKKMYCHENAACKAKKGDEK